MVRPGLNSPGAKFRNYLRIKRRLTRNALSRLIDGETMNREISQKGR
jgi:hypothetical protein